MNTIHRPLLKILLTLLFILAATTDLHAGKKIGVILTADIPYYATMHKAFAAELAKKFGGSEKFEIILQRPFPDSISWSNAARKLIAFDVDLIVAYGSPAAQAVIHEKNRIPMVYTGVYEPDQTAARIKNVTGCGYKIPLSSILRYFKRLKTIESLGIVFSSTEEDSVRQYETMRHLTAEQNITSQKIDIRSRADLEKLKKTKSDAIFITGSSIVHLWLADVMNILDDLHVPVADILPDEAEAGILMTLYQPPQGQGEMAAEMAWQILQGAKPGDIAEHTYRDTELVFNLVEARHIGINFPIHLLIEATRVVE